MGRYAATANPMCCVHLDGLPEAWRRKEAPARYFRTPHRRDRLEIVAGTSAGTVIRFRCTRLIAFYRCCASLRVLRARVVAARNRDGRPQRFASGSNGRSRTCERPEEVIIPRLKRFRAASAAVEFAAALLTACAAEGARACAEASSVLHAAENAQLSNAANRLKTLSAFHVGPGFSTPGATS